jgi:hypothetical protein
VEAAVQLCRWFPSILPVVMIIRPETLVHWHRAGFRRFWRWKSNSRGGRPRIEIELRALISTENQLRGAPRIHSELLKLGFEVAQSSVAKYMVRHRGPPSQGWRTFLRNHAPDIAAMDLFVVPTIGFKLLYGFVIVRISRRDLVWINVTTNPTAEWVARQSRNMKSYARYYNGFRTHRSLNKDTSNSRPVQRSGPISSYVILAELHHHYARV